MVPYIPTVLLWAWCFPNSPKWATRWGFCLSVISVLGAVIDWLWDGSEALKDSGEKGLFWWWLWEIVWLGVNQFCFQPWLCALQLCNVLGNSPYYNWFLLLSFCLRKRKCEVWNVSTLRVTVGIACHLTILAEARFYAPEFSFQARWVAEDQSLIWIQSSHNTLIA